MVIEVGLRVVRGPDWKWGPQDDGEGHVGTVVEIGKQGSTTSPDKTVVVHWDSGSRTNYRVGYQGAYDLRILDNAPLGIRHREIACNGCRKQEIVGMRWSCSKCYNFTLCTECYMKDVHDVTHTFIRIYSHTSTGVKVGKRAGAVKLQSKGIFAGAKVQRGPDWDWGNQDGGEGKIGKTVDIRGWENESDRSVACVVWQTGPTNVYRLGHKGKVDIKYVTAATGGSYYRDHLPVLGESADGPSANTAHCNFKVGEKVRVDLEVEILKAMQEGHGGWNPKMADYIGKVGTVHRITERGDVRVQHEGCTNRWTFHPGALTKIHQFSVDDVVKIADSMSLVKSLQRDHGEWTDQMKAALGTFGKVLKVYADGDLRVLVASQTWTFNPACCRLVNPGCGQGAPTDAAKQQQHKVVDAAGSKQIVDLLTFAPDVLVREAAEGHLNAVRDILKRFPAEVDAKSSGKTALQVSSHQGHLPLVDLLLSLGAGLECPDDDGDTALHYSAFGNQAVVMVRLLEKKAKIDAINAGGCSALHVAVNKQHLDCVKVLLQHQCQVNLQDSYGDTALHDSIGKENKEIVNLLCDYPGTDFSLCNNRGFNCLHHAALKGNHHATERILSRCTSLVNVKKEDAFSSLHLAALNGHVDVVRVLLAKGSAEIEIRNNRLQTPLLLATSQGHAAIIQLLIEQGADVTAVDEDGDSCLHIALMRQPAAAAAATVNNEAEEAPGLAQMRAELELPADTSSLSVIAAYLVSKRANLHLHNKLGKSPLDIVQQHNVQQLLKQFENLEVSPPLEKRECMVCSDDSAIVIFNPCGHRIVCRDCCMKMKKCLECQAPITAKTMIDGSPVAEAVLSRPSELEELQIRVLDMEDVLNCSICLENRKNIVFLCGHGACQQCSEPLRICHMCRKPITKRINVF